MFWFMIIAINTLWWTWMMLLVLWRQRACPRVGDRGVIALTFCDGGHVIWRQTAQSHNHLTAGLGAMPSHHLTTSQLAATEYIYNSIRKYLYPMAQLFGPKDRRSSVCYVITFHVSVNVVYSITLSVCLCLDMEIGQSTYIWFRSHT